MSRIINHNETHVSEIETGGKARNLFLLKSYGFNVPAFLVLPEKYLLENIHLSIDILQQSILAQLQVACMDGQRFAVRSSASVEDGSHHSFAGMFETYLNVEKSDIAQKALLVWQSTTSERVTTYCQTRNLALVDRLSVIIQNMVDAEISGVAFGVNPVTGNVNEQVIAAHKGLGEPLVAGEVNGETYTIKRSETKIRSKENYRSPILNKSQIEEISKILDSLYAFTGYWQDVEFAYSKGKLYLLQTRPVTQIPASVKAGKHIVWDNSNIVESYSGITLPLTFSYIITLYDKAYQQLFGVLGVSNRTMQKNADSFANMLGLLNGRVYYNLRSWYRALSLLPGYSLNASFMEKMMGVKEKFVLEEHDSYSKLSDFFRVLYMVFSVLKNLFTLEKQKRDFMRFYNNLEASYASFNPEKATADELMHLYLRLEKETLSHWKAPLVNDFFAMIFFGIFQKWSVKKFGSNTNLHNDLLSGTQSIITTEPAKRIESIVKTILTNPDYLHLFRNNDELTLWEILQQEENKDLFHPIKEYLEAFGDRYVGELKLETETFKQNPHEFIGVIKSYTDSGREPSLPGTSAETSNRVEAEKQVKLAFKGSPIKRLLFKHVQQKTRALVAGRENLRFYRTRAFGGSRRIFIGIGINFEKEGIINHYRDLFYLTKEEIFDYIKGTSVNYDLKELVEIRKKQFHVFSHEPPIYERIHTYGIVYLGNTFEFALPPVSSKGEIKGIGCSKGIVRAPIRIIVKPTDASNLEGAILVTVSTDPGWVTLFPSVSGILVERGSLLSHTAIVAREMGIPAIVGVHGLLAALHDGDWVEMNGSTGAIQIIASPQNQTL